jgi:hypothetical protein
LPSVRPSEAITSVVALGSWSRPTKVMSKRSALVFEDVMEEMELSLEEQDGSATTSSEELSCGSPTSPEG